MSIFLKHKIFFSRHRLFVFSAMAVLVLALCGILVKGSGVAGQAEEQPASWIKRCNEGDSGRCEIFQKLVVRESGLRVVEFAIGFPEKGKPARGVMILPLGILLTEDVRMQIDGGQPLKFKVRFCTQGGCYAYLNLSKPVIDLMSKGAGARIVFKTMQGQEMGVEMPLTGFTNAVQEIF